MDGIKRTWAEINLDAAVHNLEAVRSHTGAKVMAVVKADAYGHGACPIARAYQRAGVDYFAVSCLAEAEELRRGGVTEPVLVLGPTQGRYLPRMAELGLTQAVHSLNYAREVAASMAHCAGQLRVHFKIDTGMGRLGFHATRQQDVPLTAAAVAEAAELPGLVPEGIFMHFADAENPDLEFTERQLAYFEALLDALRQKGVDFPIRHCANSAAVLYYKKAHSFEYVRPGLVLYGLYPDPERTGGVELRPVMSLKSRIVDIRTVRAGESISYGRTFVAQRDKRVAVVSIGYADGLKRCLSQSGRLCVRGVRTPILGRICMDLCVIDLSGVENAEIYDPVLVFGAHDGVQVPADELAQLCSTISYEICTSVTKRVPREYVPANG